LISLLRYNGVYSSRLIEDWVERELKLLLGEYAPRDRAVCFKDLNIPATVVATDLADGRPVTRGYHVNPDQAVAVAVRESCSIPLFFQAVAGRYVDGGAVSNLPAFVFDHENRLLETRCRNWRGRSRPPSLTGAKNFKWNCNHTST
jgi:predicted acylesterase/phospholipase RssA